MSGLLTYSATPNALFIHVIILTHMDAILIASFVNVEYLFPLWRGLKYCIDKLSG